MSAAILEEASTLDSLLQHLRYIFQTFYTIRYMRVCGGVAKIPWIYLINLVS
jgi:hypothetical protein